MSKQNLNVSTMKKAILFIFLMLLLIPFVQTNAQLKFGGKLALGLASMSGKSDDESNFYDDKKPKLGFELGGVVDYSLFNGVSLEGGMLFAFKGLNMKEKHGDDWEKYNINLFYITIPLTGKYTYDLGKLKVYGQLGPYFGIGLAGKEKWAIKVDGDKDSDSETIDWGTDEEDDFLRRMDVGLMLGLGVILFDNLQAGISIEPGFANISSYRDDGVKIHNFFFGLSAVYFLGN
jgi:hypothetical protein